MEEIFAVSDVLALLGPGMVAGIGLGSLFWLLGYVVSGIYSLIGK